MPEIKISIITPCYNHGSFLEETIQSVNSYKWKVAVEHIIVNDGSTDVATLEKLDELKKKGIKIIDQPNAGPANARNTGIAVAQGKYIIPLDSDNKLRPEIFEKAFDIMEANSNIAVTYTNAQCFGLKEIVWEPGNIDQTLLLAGNYIDTCALIRMSDIKAVGGYDDKIPFHGNEDWELWVKMMFHGFKFYYLKEIGYDYRMADLSLSKRESAPNQKSIDEYMVKKYPAQYAAHYQELVKEKKMYEHLKKYLRESKIKSIVKILLGKPVNKY